MRSTITITRNWQIHLPKKARKIAGIQTPMRLEVEAEKGKIILTPQKDSILDYGGKYASYGQGKKINLDQIRDTIDYSAL